MSSCDCIDCMESFGKVKHCFDLCVTQSTHCIPVSVGPALLCNVPCKTNTKAGKPQYLVWKTREAEHEWRWRKLLLEYLRATRLQQTQVSLGFCLRINKTSSGSQGFSPFTSVQPIQVQSLYIYCILNNHN